MYLIPKDCPSFSFMRKIVGPRLTLNGARKPYVTLKKRTARRVCLCLSLRIKVNLWALLYRL